MSHLKVLFKRTLRVMDSHETGVGLMRCPKAWGAVLVVASSESDMVHTSVGVILIGPVVSGTFINIRIAIRAISRIVIPSTRTSTDTSTGSLSRPLCSHASCSSAGPWLY